MTCDTSRARDRGTIANATLLTDPPTAPSKATAWRLFRCLGIVAWPMSKDEQERVQATLDAIGAQCEQLEVLQERFHTGYAAAFDEAGAIEAAKRWHDRTFKLLAERVSVTEAKKFAPLIVPHRRIRSALDYGEWLGRFHAFLVELHDDIAAHPNDPTYDKLLGGNMQKRAAESKSPLTDAPSPFRFDVFLSYSSLDKDEAREVESSLSRARRKCFLSEKTLKPGDDFQSEIRDALAASREVWILASPNSRKSDWVQREVAAAWALQKPIVPILLRCAASDLPGILADKHAIDFHKLPQLLKQRGWVE